MARKTHLERLTQSQRKRRGRFLEAQRGNTSQRNADLKRKRTQ